MSKTNSMTGINQERKRWFSKKQEIHYKNISSSISIPYSIKPLIGISRCVENIFLKVSSQFIVIFLIFSTADNRFGLLKIHIFWKYMLHVLIKNWSRADSMTQPVPMNQSSSRMHPAWRHDKSPGIAIFLLTFILSESG